MKPENLSDAISGPCPICIEKILFLTDNKVSYVNNIYEGVIDASSNTCLSSRLYFWKSVFKILLHTFPRTKQYFEMDEVYIKLKFS